MGLGMQLLGWHEDFVALLVARGFRVIRFDNRDIGLSQSFDHLGVPNLALDSLRHALGLRVKSAVHARRHGAPTASACSTRSASREAHVCGASMGGMIAQHLAARHPERVKSLTLMMTSSGARRLPRPDAEGARRDDLAAARPQRRRGIVEHYVNLYALIGSPAYPSPTRLPARALHAIGAALLPAGRARRARWSRSPPTATARRCSARSACRRQSSTAAPIRWSRSPAGTTSRRRSRGATIDLIDGMGHDLPLPLLPRFVAGIAAAPAARA